MDWKIGDTIVLKKPFWHLGEDLGNKEAIIIDIQSYLLVNVKKYQYNPIKCLRYEIQSKEIHSDIESYVNDFFSSFGS
jgi:hypothetical protein